MIAEYKTIKAQMEQRKEIIDKLKVDMEGLMGKNEADRERIANEYKSRLEEMVKRMKEEAEKNDETSEKKD